MKALMIGGTGVISTSVSQLALAQGWDVTLLNRGSRSSEVPGARQLIADMNDEAAVRVALAEETYDVVADFIAVSCTAILFTIEFRKAMARLEGGKN